MKIELELNKNKYAIGVDGNCFTAIKVGVNTTEDSKNYGQKTERELGYFTTLSKVCLRLCREEIGQSEDVVTMNEFASRVEAVNKQLLDQLNKISI